MIQYQPQKFPLKYQAKLSTIRHEKEPKATTHLWFFPKILIISDHSHFLLIHQRSLTHHNLSVSPVLPLQPPPPLELKEEQQLILHFPARFATELTPAGVFVDDTSKQFTLYHQDWTASGAPRLALLSVLAK